MKPLSPTLKEKKRYIMYSVEAQKAIRAQAIITELQKILGVFESAKAGMQSIKFSQNKGVLRVSLHSLPKVRAAITLLQKVQDIPCRVRIQKTTGILNKTDEFMEVQ